MAQRDKLEQNHVFVSRIMARAQVTHTLGFLINVHGRLTILGKFAGQDYLLLLFFYSMILINRVDLNKRVDGKIHIMKFTELFLDI